MNSIWSIINVSIRRLFNLHDDKAEDQEIIDSIKKNVEFKGPNLWALIFAIFIASIGLNVGSSAVIIGAMLISPLMGPIMGIGLGIGINDINLLKKGLKNLLVAVIISIITSTIYFLITPLHEPQPELLARTNPTIWDVFIAFFGGLAGIVAGTRKEKSNVIPGVAIATALMPPLCTAGFGAAMGNIYYFMGAIYLFFINSVFICISTYLVVRALHLRKATIEDPRHEKRVARYILLLVIITILPSIYLAVQIVNKSIFESNAATFTKSEFDFSNPQIVTKKFLYDHGQQKIELLLIGEELSESKIDSIKKTLPKYHLKNTKLVIRQGLNAKQHIDLAQIKASILEDVFNKTKMADTLAATDESKTTSVPDLKKEIHSLYPSILQYSLTKSVFLKIDTTGADTVMIFAATYSKPIKKNDRVRLERWLKSRINVDSVLIITLKK